MNSLLSLLPGKGPAEAAQAPPAKREETAVTCSDGCRSASGQKPDGVAGGGGGGSGAHRLVGWRRRSQLHFCWPTQAGVAAVRPPGRPHSGARARMVWQPVSRGEQVSGLLTLRPFSGRTPAGTACEWLTDTDNLKLCLEGITGT